MADYNLGTAQGSIKITYDDSGAAQARKGIDSIKGSAGSSEAAFNRLAGASAIAGGAIAAGLAVAGNKAIDFEKQISAIGAVSGATGSQLEVLRAKALQLGADTTFSASEAANAMEELAKAGVPLEAILNGAADATVALAAAGGVSLPEAATIASNAMNAFGLAAKDLGHVADLIAGASNASAIDVSEFGQSLQQAGAVANLVGLSFDDLAAAIALMGNAGIKGSDAGTSLKTMLSNLQPVTLKQKELFRDLGLTLKNGSNAFFDAQGNIKGLAEISGILNTATKGMTSAQKQLTLETIFGSDAIRAAAVLTDAGAAGFNNMADAMGKVTAEDVAAKRLDNTAGAIEQLKGSAETAGIAIGTIMMPAIKALAQGLTKLANSFSALSPETQKTILIVTGVVAAVLLAMAAIIKITSFVKAFMVAWRLLNISFIASPIGLIITAIIALIVIIVLIATKTTWFQTIWEHVWSFLKMVGAWFAGPFAGFFVDAWNWITHAFDTAARFIVGLVIGFMLKIHDFISFNLALIQAIWNRFLSDIRAVWDAAWAFVVGIIQNAVATVRAVIDKILQIFGFFKAGVAALKAAIIENFLNAVDFIKSIPGRISDALGNLGSLLFNKGRDLVQGLINGVKSLFGSVANVARDLIGQITKFLPGSPAEVGPLSGRGYVLKRGQRFTQEFAEGITSQEGDATRAIASLIESVAATLPTDSSAAVSSALSGIAVAQTRPFVAPAPVQPVNKAGDVLINTLQLQGVWDFSDPTAARRIVATLHDELDRYAKGYK